MNLEQLSNELLLDIFEYLQSVHLIQAFYKLNTRFNALIIAHFKNHGLNLQSISKHTFNTICQEYLPLIADHITALRLSDDDDTPEEIDIFLSNPRAFYHFTRLTTLTLNHISSIETFEKFVKHFTRLRNLTRFELIDCCVLFKPKILRSLINGIWRLPKLTSCSLDLQIDSNDLLRIPSVRSKSIKHLYIENILFDMNDLIQLFRSTPNLQHLTAKILKIPDDQRFPFEIKSILSLRLIVDHLTNGTMSLIQNMPNLISLTLQTGKHHMDGHRWEQFITDYLPKLKIFQFWMLIILKKEEEVHKIIDSYRTPFWLVHRRWFVRCHFASSGDSFAMFTYTLPYAFTFYSYGVLGLDSVTISTCPNETDYLHYNVVTKLMHSSIFTDKLLSNLRFQNIRQIELTIPYPDIFLSLLLRIDRLTSLNVNSTGDIDSDTALLQLNDLINQVPFLHSLTISDWPASSIQELPLHIKSNSIRRLDLQSGHYLNRDRCFNSQQCAAFLRTSWAKQCEVLQIVVNDQSIIDDLINNMTNLRALKVMLQLSQYDGYRPTLQERVRWITSGFSRTFTDNLVGIKTMRFWIR